MQRDREKDNANLERASLRKGTASMCDLPLGQRFETVVGRGEAVQVALLEEYIRCFRKVSRDTQHFNALLRCMHPSVELAFSTITPLFFEDALSVVDLLHPVMRVVCALYFKHLRRTWFALENDRLDKLYRKLADGEIKVV
jgi:hypothetical protein